MIIWQRILVAYLAGLVRQILLDLSSDLRERHERFDIRWVCEMILNAIFWPVVAVVTLAIAIYLRRKGAFPIEREKAYIKE